MFYVEQSQRLNIAHTFIEILIPCPHVFKEANEQYLDKMHT